jgi:hypothetical protein
LTTRRSGAALLNISGITLRLAYRSFSPTFYPECDPSATPNGAENKMRAGCRLNGRRAF